MAKYIAVLTSDEGLGYWSAVQWADNKADIDGNLYYNSEVRLTFPKTPDDTRMNEKTIIEVSTLAQGTAAVYRLATASVNKLKLASNKASKALLAELKSKTENL